MSRWGEMFHALSHPRDTVDTVRHRGAPPVTVSHNVNSVTGVGEPLISGRVRSNQR